MKKLIITMLIAVIVTTFSLISSFAQDTTGDTMGTNMDTTEQAMTPVSETSDETSDSSTLMTDPAPTSNQANWCYAGGPWGDGRCNTGDFATTQYMWLAGWCHAQVENGNYMGTADDCLAFTNMAGMSNTGVTYDYSSLDVNSNMFFDCKIEYDSATGQVTSIAKWDDRVNKQDQIIFYTNLPGLENYATSISAGDTAAGITNSTLQGRTLSRGSAKLNSTATGQDFGPTSCEIVSS